jgi:hypothetical protein
MGSPWRWWLPAYHGKPSAFEFYGFLLNSISKVTCIDADGTSKEIKTS